MKIDFHNHYYPPEYLAAITTGTTKACMDYDAEGNPRLHYPGDYNIRVPGHRDLDHREGVLKKHGVDKQVLTFTTPGTHFEEPATAVAMEQYWLPEDQVGAVPSGRCGAATGGAVRSRLRGL